MRGVMEKCTFCVQRIQNVKIKAKNAKRPIDDGEIKTACQQTCPADAIVFGDLNDPKARVTADHALPRAYSLLEELNNSPRVRYLGKVRNPNPELV
jgi:molybdopterin-containing oxidoreductase family iron-sulfur binding subunit